MDNIEKFPISASIGDEVLVMESTIGIIKCMVTRVHDDRHYDMYNEPHNVSIQRLPFKYIHSNITLEKRLHDRI